MNRKKLVAIVVIAAIVLVVVGVVLFGGGVAKAPQVAGTPTSSSSIGASAVAGSEASSTTNSPGLSIVYNTTTVAVYKGSSFSLLYPLSWRVYTISPFSMNDFGGKYQDGVIIPQTGAEIDVVMTTIGGPLQDIMTTELMSATSIATSTVAVNGISCDRADYRNTYAEGFASQDIAIYCLRGQSLWKIYFSNRVGDASRTIELSDLNTVLGSMKFLP